MSGPDEFAGRIHEWYVPKFGPRRFRAFVGMTFLPYTLMNAAYVVIGSALAPDFHLDRAAALALVYVLAVGLSAHSLDAMGENKPWGRVLTERQLLALATISLALALVIGGYYAITYAPILFAVGSAELFFLFAYNLELFKSRFHSKTWFAFSWGFLPVLAGYSLQAGTLDIVSLLGGAFGFATAFVEASVSRPYKRLISAGGAQSPGKALRYEKILKGIVSSVLLVCASLIVYRLA